MKERSASLQKSSKLKENGSLIIANKTYNPVEFCSTFNYDYPTKVAERGLTIIQAIDGTTPTLAKVTNTLGSTTIQSVIELWIDRLNDFYGKGTLDEFQMKELSTLILSEYYYLKMAELAIFFNRFKLGRYGEFYGRIDPLRIMSALREFATERRDSIIEHERQEREQYYAEQREREDKLRYETFCQERAMKSLINFIIEILDITTGIKK